jgi:hypothetical protein
MPEVHAPNDIDRGEPRHTHAVGRMARWEAAGMNTTQIPTHNNVSNRLGPNLRASALLDSPTGHT